MLWYTMESGLVETSGFGPDLTEDGNVFDDFTVALK